MRRPHSLSVVPDPLPRPGKTLCALTLFLLALGSCATAALAQDSEAVPANDSNTVESASINTPAPSTTAETPAAVPAPEAHVQPILHSTLNLKFPHKYDVDRIGDRGIGKGFNFFSLSRERAMGENMSRDLDAHLHLVRDPELNAYVNRVVQNLALHSDASLPITVRVVENDEVNAYSLPGGFLYVNSGLIAACPDEATFAGILAHEVAHVAARHATKTMTRQMLFKMSTLPLIFVSGGIAAGIGNAAGFAIPFTNMKFNRNAEREADLLAVEYSYSAGYDPEAFVQFFETLQTRQKHKMPKFFGLMLTSHPMNDERIKRAQAEIETLLPEKSDYVIDTSDFRAAKDRLFQVVRQPCTDANGRPILVSAGQKCGDKADNKRPSLRDTLHRKPKTTE